MNHVHYLREIAVLKKRAILFAIELQQLKQLKQPDGKIIRRNNNSASAMYKKILNELCALKMSSIIRYEQQSSALLPDKSNLATLLLLRKLKEKFFLKIISTEIDKNNSQWDFKPALYTSPGSDRLSSADSVEQILRENGVAHNMMVDCYVKMIDRLISVDGCTQLVWLLQSMAIMEQKYNRNEQRYLQNLEAA